MDGVKGPLDCVVGYQKNFEIFYMPARETHHKWLFPPLGGPKVVNNQSGWVMGC